MSEGERRRPLRCKRYGVDRNHRIHHSETREVSGCRPHVATIEYSMLECVVCRAVAFCVEGTMFAADRSSRWTRTYPGDLPPFKPEGASQRSRESGGRGDSSAMR